MQVVSSYSSMRDYVVFTNKRVISVNVQGLTGKKKDFTSLPYSKVQAFSIETKLFQSKCIRQAWKLLPEDIIVVVQ